MKVLISECYICFVDIVYLSQLVIGECRCLSYMQLGFSPVTGSYILVLV